MVPLRDRIERLNEKSRQHVENEYLASLKYRRLSDEGNAGLGLIVLLRKSGHPLEYTFRRLTEGVYYFTLTVTMRLGLPC